VRRYLWIDPERLLGIEAWISAAQSHGLASSHNDDEFIRCDSHVAGDRRNLVSYNYMGRLLQPVYEEMEVGQFRDNRERLI